jgi:hypothetical protein
MRNNEDGQLRWRVVCNVFDIPITLFNQYLYPFLLCGLCTFVYSVRKLSRTGLTRFVPLPLEGTGKDREP